MKRNIQLLISEEYAEKIISENDSVRLLDEVIDENRSYSTLPYRFFFRKKKCNHSPSVLGSDKSFAAKMNNLMPPLYSNNDIVAGDKPQNLKIKSRKNRKNCGFCGFLFYLLRKKELLPMTGSRVKINI